MKAVYVKIIITVAVVLAVYTFVGQLVPQFKGGFPPEESEIKPQTTQEDLVKIGQDLVSNRGCLTCHAISGKEQGRCPNLAGVGSIAGARFSGYNAEQYLLRRLIDPDFSEVPGYPKIMPKVWQPPIALSWAEVKAVTAYLESLGGKVTMRITPEDLEDKPHVIKFPDGAAVTVKKVESAKEIPEAVLKEGHQVMMSLPEKTRCIACHKIGGEMPKGWFPNGFGQYCPDLSQIGAMHDLDYIKQKIKNPQSLPTVTGYPKTMMPGDYEKTLKKIYGDQWQEKLNALSSFILSYRGQQKLPPEFSAWIIGGMFVLSVVLGMFAGRKKT